MHQTTHTQPLRMLLVVLLGLPSLPALSQSTVPDAGSLLRETERSLQVPRAAPQPQAAPAARPMPSDAKAARITVQQITIEGASLVPTAELDALVADRRGQSLSLAELEYTAQRIAEYYRARGWYARVFLPQQDVTEGNVRIHVLEGRYGGSTIAAQGQRADAAKVQRMVTRSLQPGAPLSSADLERGLLIANDLPGVRATGLLQAGDQQGETQLALSVQDTPFVTGDVGLNNYGVASTGRLQAVAGLALNNLSGGGDQLALRLLAAQDIRSGLARYSLPLGDSGLRLATQLSTLDYSLGGSYRDLQAEGKAHTGGLSLSYPLIRQAAHNLQLTAGYEHRRYDDDALGQSLRRHRVNAATLGVNGDVRDAFGGGGITWGGAQLTHGRLGIRDINNDRAVDAATARSAGGYQKLAWNLNRLQNLGSGWQVQAALSGQFAGDNLGSSERFTLGGPSQVRAYAVNEASGDAGVLFKLELQRELGKGWQATAFYDTGRIRQHHQPWTGWNARSGQPNSYSLSGAGFGLNWRHPDWFLTASLSTPIGRRPDQGDGARPSGVRGWISLTRLL
ncbi:ShlB/FhaC/HecB family hemolysin secretion/activation protein [Pigmentiphaga aceris]|uniref:ShlB/FhaC/HecB family hemolysin secretion/activation protein n=1 Tax=Pigmentiphaga aceris TaxID=1940612 RepID=A0A5C0B594_9BURK|nr:ShlB/FhaC/HecB family hemolysin secretion/activation protein [Pigmentiphaga aceris]QEI08450.1 ShlB/FhaC/HecB family hemolysin secretion/activation protein [Pigmentiphaga aceris]